MMVMDMPAGRSAPPHLIHDRMAEEIAAPGFERLSSARILEILEDCMDLQGLGNPIHVEA